MKNTEILRLEDPLRSALWERVIETIETYLTTVNSAHPAPQPDPATVQSLLAPIDFTRPLDTLEAVDFVARGLWQYQVHTPHPRYFGLFNPAPTTMGIAADALAAAFNPQLATWSHSPFAVEVEQHLLRAFGSRFGYDPHQVGGTFASGGAEANHTAMLTALVHAFPRLDRRGLRGLDRQPTMYITTQSHHSFMKAARLCGLGTDAVRTIPVDDWLQMSVEALSAQIARDREDGFAPFLVTATAGTTNAGVIDPIPPIADVAAREGLWLHVDAAWGGAAALVPELRHLLNGVERADSLTFDAHKWLSVPMGAGIFLTRRRDTLRQTFRITADYMPPEADGPGVIDPYTHSIQWSRRFIGLKVFLSLAVAGWDGYAAVLRHQTDMGHLLRRELSASGWDVLPVTELPVVCFVDGQKPGGRSTAFVEAIAAEIVSSGAAWISTTRLGADLPVLRACITNYRTEPEDVHALVNALNEARQKIYARR